MNFLEKLSNTLGPSGAEGSVRELIRREITPYVDSIKIDNFGNLIAHKKGKGEKVMLAAHMDEIGLMVKSVNDEGHLTFAVVGGVEPITLTGQIIYLMDSDKKIKCKGVVTFLELHEDLQLEEMPRIMDLYIDTGLTKKELEKKGIGIGCYGVFTTKFDTLGHKNILCGKALDDRIGCYMLVEVAKKLKKVNQNVYYVFTVQEEIGLYGSKVSAQGINPDWGIAVDVTNADDAASKNLTTLGKGPVVILMDAEIITNRCLDEWLKKIAKQHKIPLQLKVEEMGTTDATQIMLHKEGTPSSVLGVAVRNLHSSVSVAHQQDIENGIKLLCELLKKPPKICLN